MIGELVDWYLSVDFDQLDKVNSRIGNYIINGQLSEADSLLRTKWDIPVFLN